MNLLLLDPGEVGAGGSVRLTGRRADHLRRVLSVAAGRRLRAGVLGRGIGTARVTAVGGVDGVGGERVDLILEGPWTTPSPPLADLILALPRPKALRRILRLCAALGVGRLDLVNAWRVEKSYFSSPVLEPAAIERELRLGAEQGGTSRLPEVAVHRLFVPFLERFDSEPPVRPRLLAQPGASPLGPSALSAWVGASTGSDDGQVAEPGSTGAPPPPPPSAQDGRPLLAIGPEGGWIEDELGSFDRAGFRPVSLGPWILTSEAAVAVAVGQLQVLLNRS